MNEFWNSWGGVAAVLVISALISAAALIPQYRYNKKRLKTDPAYARRAQIEDDIRENLPKFWTLPATLGMILGIVIIAFGIEYFWNTPGITPRSDLLDGFIVVVSGIIVSVSFLASRVLPMAREIDRRRREAYGQT